MRGRARKSLLGHGYGDCGLPRVAGAIAALQAEDKIGVMLPCNVVLQELHSGRTEISAVDPVASMQAIENPKLAEIASSVRLALQEVIADIGTKQGSPA
ncbi:DUF302 domain-containing protein [Bradyrhizobium sp.]|uniref:DUF302 domain-containing protein n=1 Tax=Bradyrhizobium sp. TaxID=376 RepID=UPI0025B8C9B5|nr:DUF302 domain-containing protein [Bradyrhizobium sp.]